jgi:hypothetical protein
MGALTAAIEWDKIGELLWAAPLAGLAVAITYALMIVGFARADDTRRDGGGAATAMAYTVLGVLSTLAFFAVVAYGVIIIVKK